MTSPNYVYTTYIGTSVERVWEALTKSEHTEVYFFGRKVQSTWQVGDEVRFIKENDELDVTGELLEFTLFENITYTWTAPSDTTQRDQPMIVSFALTQLEDTIKLTLMHSNLVDSDIMEESNTFYGLNNGWPAILSNLKSYLETGKPLKAIHV